MEQRVELHDLRLRLKKHGRNIIIKKDLRYRIDYLKNNIGLKGVSYEQSTGGSGISKTTERQALIITEAEEKLDNFLKMRGIEIERIENALKILTVKEREIIEAKHFTDDNWETVSYIAKKSVKQCKRIEVEALKKMYEILKDFILNNKLKKKKIFYDLKG